MANVKISDLPAASTPLTGTELVPIVQSGVTSQTTISEFANEAIKTTAAFLPAGTGAVPTTVQAKLRETVSVKDFGAVGDGVTDDTTAFTNAAATNNAILIPKGTYKVTSDVSGTFFSYDEIIFTDKAIYYVNLSVSGNSVALNFANGWGVYTEELDGDVNAAEDIAKLGVSYVVYYSYALTDNDRVTKSKKDFANLKKHGIGVILWVSDTTNTVTRTTLLNQYTDVDNLIAWYVFDEPIYKGISVADQTAGIAASKLVKNLPCVTAENVESFPGFGLSPNFDMVFVDCYYQIANYDLPILTDSDALNVYGAIASIAQIYGVNKIVPVYETYLEPSDPGISFANLLRTLIYKKQMFGSGVLFIYSANITATSSFKTISNDTTIRTAAESIMQYPVPYDRSFSCNYFSPISTVVTITIASPGVVSWVAHGLSNGDVVSFTTSGALPTGLTANTFYYVVNKTTDNFQVSATSGGAAINTSGPQSGIHTCITSSGNSSVSDPSYSYTSTKQKTSILNMVDARSTATIEYAPVRLPQRAGIFLTSAQFLVLDFGRSIKSVKLLGRFFNNGQPLGTISTLDIKIPSVANMTSGDIVSSVTLPATTLTGTALLSVTVENLNSRYLILKPTGANWNTETGFEALGYSAINF